MKHLLFLICLSISLSSLGQSANFGNTAENYCKFLGYDLVIDPATNRTACTLPNGELVNPWDFFKGKVGQEYSYCAKKSYTIRTKNIEYNGANFEIPICDKKNGKNVSLKELLSKNQKYNELFMVDASNAALFDTVLFNDQQRRPPPTSDCKGPDQGYARSFDWRNIDGDDFVNPPGNQQSTRLCYAFASASVAESVLAITEDTPYGSGIHDFSEAFLGYMGSYFPYADTIPPYIWWAIRGYSGLQQTNRHQICEKLCANGVVEEDDFPLVVDSITGRIVDSVFTEWGADRYRFTSWETVDTLVTAIKDALEDGPVLASMFYDQYIHENYTNGILTGSNEPGTTHMVAIVGWDVYVNEEAEECEFWIVKNSYGEGWGGLDGYMHVSTNFHLQINNHILKLEYVVPSIESSYLACENQTISNISSYAGTGHHRPDPYTLFNGYTSAEEWTFGNTANLSAKSTSSEEATLIFRVPFTNYVQCDTTIDPDIIEYYEKQVWAGVPVAPTVTGSTLIGCYEPTWYYAYANSPTGLCTAESFTWEISSGLQLLNTYSNPARIRVQATGTGDYVIKSFATNHVGTDSTYYYIQAFCVAPLINVFPNPVSNELNVEITTSENYEPDFEIDLIDSANKKWKTKNTKSKTTTIFVGDIPKGSYLLRISILINGKKVEEKNKTIMII